MSFNYSAPEFNYAAPEQAKVCFQELTSEALAEAELRQFRRLTATVPSRSRFVRTLRAKLFKSSS